MTLKREEIKEEKGTLIPLLKVPIGTKLDLSKPSILVLPNGRVLIVGKELDAGRADMEHVRCKNS